MKSPSRKTNPSNTPPRNDGTHSRRAFLSDCAKGIGGVAVAGLAAPSLLASPAGAPRQAAAPVAGEYDVVVCGGGPAGFIAAVAAARGGARTALVERYGFLGGMATAGLVSPVSVFNLNGRRVIGGMPWEFVEKLSAIGGAGVDLPRGNVTFCPEKYKLAAQRMVVDAGVTLYLHSYLTSCRQNNGTLSHAVIENKNGAQTLAAKYFIDCTGDADLALRAGVPMQPAPENLQPASLIFMLGNVDTDAIPPNRLRHGLPGSQDTDFRAILQKLSKTQKIPLFGGPWYNSTLSKGVVVVNITRTAANMADNREATEAECRLREDVHTFVDLLRKHAPAFRDATLLTTATQTGIRETRRILGAHTLTGAEYLAATKFPDTIARGCHPVDIHSSNSARQRAEYLKQPGNVPYRCLHSPGFPNLLVAGRPFSGDEVASASVRVQASAMCLGQAAGAAAALCLADNRDVSQVNITRLRETLIQSGAILD
ncbi:glycine/D-amino acid oxidase-like deaminating enzyme [Ereboglobus sp. PH5-5]|uniref:FAD-dependent oxidoreductase n=1 Tax=Ereboglobus sp. PH5-5 TaxID=2940529 RepID=UPI002404E16C|nr:FAD-dependent oxidoreductase [Ereboglobus sp. PH5-5]MDF9832098.1 glycine/D-amino acid oxidase-like deaminating enzyme [Ereboglobus sp. PH5-5]